MVRSWWPWLAGRSEGRVEGQSCTSDQGPGQPELSSPVYSRYQSSVVECIDIIIHYLLLVWKQSVRGNYFRKLLLATNTP